MRTIHSSLPFLVGLLLTACNRAEIGSKPSARITTLPFSTTSTVVPPIPTQPIPTSTSAVVQDCFLDFHLGAWQDMDGNGLWDPSEPPLEGVRFHLNGTYAELWGYPYLSKADGWVNLETWSPGGCPVRNFTIIADPPESYDPTTPASITISLAAGKSPFEVRFGFRAVTQ
jgi:hypothetical protein